MAKAGYKLVDIPVDEYAKRRSKHVALWNSLMDAYHQNRAILVGGGTVAERNCMRVSMANRAIRSGFRFRYRTADNSTAICWLTKEKS